MFLKDLKKIFRIIRLLRSAFGDYKFHILVLTALGFLSGMLGGVGINTIIPLFAVVSGNGTQEMDTISKYIEKFFFYFNIDFTLNYLIIFIISLFILKALATILFSYINIRIATGYEEQTRNNLFKATLNADWSYLLKQKLGHLEIILMMNVQESRNLLKLIGVSIMSFTSLLAYLIIALNISWHITLLILGVGAVFFIALKPLVQRMRKISYRVEEVNRDVAHHVNECMIGMKTYKAMSVNDSIFDLAREYFKIIRNINIKACVLQIFTSSLMEPISIILIVAIFLFTYKTSAFNFAILAAMIYIIKQIFFYIQQIQGHFLGISAYAPHLEKVLAYGSQAVRHKERSRGSKSFQFNNTLAFKNVSFFYDKEKKVLSDVNFEIKNGEMVGLIGPSGAGKTTIVDLVLRLFTPDSGMVLLDGKNIEEIDIEEWRRNIGYVSQDIFLINDTIANNIKFYDDSITDKEIEEAAKMADIYDFVQSCPGGFLTVVGERGIQLSMGQRQRIVIARILARNPKFLVLDEATSSLDNESEIKIQRVIKNLKGKITVLAIAHRLSTVINSDKLIVLEDGKIIEQGPYQELLKNKKSYFSKVYKSKI